MMTSRNDRHDPSRAELLLIRSGQHLWKLCKQTQDPILEAALETIWDAKRKVREELNLERRVQADRVKAYFRNVRGKAA